MAHKRVVSRHTFRRKARERERLTTAVLALANGRPLPGQSVGPSRAAMLDAQDSLRATMVDDTRGLPRSWGVKVVKADADEAGRWLVVGTDRVRA